MSEEIKQKETDGLNHNTDELKTVQAEFDNEERAAFMLAEEHPKRLKKTLKNLRPEACGRLLYNLIMFPLEQVPLLGKAENDAMAYIEQVLGDKAVMLKYAVENQEKDKELAEELEKNVDKTEENSDNK